MRDLEGTRASAPAKTPAKRLWILGAVLFLWVAAVLGRLVYLQVVKYQFFLSLASRQRGRVIDVDPRRGTIYDRNGTELAMSIDVDSVFAVPSEIPDQETTAQILANVLGLDVQDLLARVRSLLRHFSQPASLRRPFRYALYAY